MHAYSLLVTVSAFEFIVSVSADCCSCRSCQKPVPRLMLPLNILRSSKSKCGRKCFCCDDGVRL